jgi:hypothetical protein
VADWYKSYGALEIPKAPLSLVLPYTVFIECDEARRHSDLIGLVTVRCHGIAPGFILFLSLWGEEVGAPANASLKNEGFCNAGRQLVPAGENMAIVVAKPVSNS